MVNYHGHSSFKSGFLTTSYKSRDDPPSNPIIYGTFHLWEYLQEKASEIAVEMAASIAVEAIFVLQQGSPLTVGYVDLFLLPLLQLG